MYAFCIAVATHVMYELRIAVATHVMSCMHACITMDGFETHLGHAAPQEKAYTNGSGAKPSEQCAAKPAKIDGEEIGEGERRVLPSVRKFGW